MSSVDKAARRRRTRRQVLRRSRDRRGPFAHSVQGCARCRKAKEYRAVYLLTKSLASGRRRDRLRHLHVQPDPTDAHSPSLAFARATSPFPSACTKEQLTFSVAGAQ